MTKQTTIAAVCLAAAATFAVAWGQPQPAGTGGECPSDIDNNGEVGITDFLQVLGDWGPCPSSSRVVDMNKFEVFSGTKFLVQLRSDNRLQLYMISPGGPCWTCDETVPQLNTWTDVTPPPLPIDAVPVTVMSSGPQGLYVVYSDGSVFSANINMDQLPGGTNCVDGDYCILTLGEWSPLP